MERLNEIAESVRIFYLMQLYAWKGVVAYRLQFIIGFLDYVGYPISTLIFVYLLYSLSSGIGGWSFYQMVFLAGTISIVRFGTKYLVKPSNLVNALQSGEVDTYLIRPYSKFLAAISQFGSKTTIGSVFGGIALIVYASSSMAFTVASAMEFVVMLLLGTFAVTVFIMFLLLASYRLFAGGEWVDRMLNIVFNANEYPISIYGIMGSLLFTIVLPVGIAIYYPASAFMGKISGIEIAAVIVISIAIILSSRWLFYKSFEKYTSGGG